VSADRKGLKGGSRKASKVTNLCRSDGPTFHVEHPFGRPKRFNSERNDVSTSWQLRRLTSTY